MNILLMLTALSITPQDGSLVFFENGNQFVQNQTQSSLTHVGTIVLQAAEPWVYEAVMPKIRKIKLADYCEEIRRGNIKKNPKIKVWIANPNQTFTDEQKREYFEYLENQLGRRYSLASYLDGRSHNGIHCCELTGNALKRLGLNYTQNSGRDDPFDVWKKTKQFYKERELIIE